MKNIAYDLPKPRLPRILNKFLLVRMQEDGSEIRIFKTDTNRKGAHRINPIEKLYEAKKLTRQERSAALNYQHQFHLANLSHHARPSYDGTPISSVAAKSGDPIPSQSQLDANRYVYAIQKKLTVSCNYETRYLNGKYEIIELQLPEILEKVFEKQIAITNLEKPLGLDRRTIHDRVKRICEIMLDK